MIGYLKKFPSVYINGWSIGTGVAGPFPAVLYIFYKYIKMAYYMVYISLIPFYAMYWWLFL